MLQVSVKWSSSLSAPFTVSNSVWQGGVLFPILFAINIDVLICCLSILGVGGHWRHLFVGCLCYADDVVLLAPSIDALRRVLHVYTSFADDYRLRFNPTKTQLICFACSLSHLLQIPLSFWVVCHYLLRRQFSTLATFCLVI